MKERKVIFILLCLTIVAMIAIDIKVGIENYYKAWYWKCIQNDSVGCTNLAICHTRGKFAGQCSTVAMVTRGNLK